jgi:outer membrane protein OmpA-like peptidoglycan-associated protein
MSVPPGVQPTDGTLITHAFDEGSFLVGTTVTPKRGKFATGYLTRTPEGFHEPADAAWKKWEPVLKAAGWVTKGHDGDSYTVQKTSGTTESWLAIWLAEYQDPRLTLVQLPAAPRRIDLVAPAAMPERVAATQEWPFLKAPAGSKLENAATINEPLDMTVAGSDKEPHLVGRAYVIRQYTPPASLSQLEFELAYADALTRAGWTVLPRGGVPDGEGVVRAHYAANGRDIWASLGRASDDSNTGMSFTVADLGADDWGKALAGACKLPLYGVTFDFDKATLKPESTPVLEKAAAALTANPSLNVEVQGHTDDVGDEAYNLRLSGQRAESVRAWLAQHGIAAARLTSKGYGKTQPVVENSSDANRARNRRVELSCRK